MDSSSRRAFFRTLAGGGVMLACATSTCDQKQAEADPLPSPGPFLWAPIRWQPDYPGKDDVNLWPYGGLVTGPDYMTLHNWRNYRDRVQALARAAFDEQRRQAEAQSCPAVFSYRHARVAGDGRSAVYEWLGRLDPGSPWMPSFADHLA